MCKLVEQLTFLLFLIIGEDNVVEIFQQAQRFQETTTTIGLPFIGKEIDNLKYI